MEEREWKMLAARVPVDLHRAVKVHAAQTGLSVAEVVERAVREYLEREQKEK